MIDNPLLREGRIGMGFAAIDPSISTGSLAAAHTMTVVNGEKPAVIDAAAAIEHIAERVKAGDLSDLEDILVGQAVSLNVMAMDMLTRSRKAGTSDAANTLGAVGLRAVAQSRAAIDSLVNLKFPRQTTFVKQANVNQGGQMQVNNPSPYADPSRTPAHEASPPSELLLEANASPTLEPRATRRASRSNPKLATVGVIHRTKDVGGKSRGRA